MKRMITPLLALTIVASATIASDASNALNSYLRIAADDTKIVIAGSAWGTLDALQRGEHVSGRPPRGTKGCSLTTDGETYPVLSRLEGKGNDLLGKGGAWLTVEDTAGEDFVYHFTGISDFSCNARARICSFGFDAVEVTSR